MEVYDADKEVSLTQDRIEFEKVPESYEILDMEDANRPADWLDLRRGKKKEWFAHVKEYVFLVSYLSKEIQRHPPITIGFDIPEGHYDQDTLVKTISRHINDELYDVFKMVNASMKLHGKKLLDIKDTYVC